MSTCVTEAMLDVWAQGVQWYAVVNDLIGGWSVVTADVSSLSELRYEEDETHRMVADLMSESIARYLVHLHNQRLGVS